MIETAYLLSPFHCELIRLLTLHPEGRASQDKIALVKARGPLEIRVDDLLVDAGNIVEDIGKVSAVQIERVDGGVAVRVLLRGFVEGQPVHQRRKLVRHDCVRARGAQQGIRSMELTSLNEIAL